MLLSDGDPVLFDHHSEGATPRFSDFSQETIPPESDHRSLTPVQLELLVGKEFVQAAIFPDGIDRVSILSSPVPTLVLETQPSNPPKPTVIIGDAEERVVDIVPLESEELQGRELQDDLTQSPDGGDSVDVEHPPLKVSEAQKSGVVGNQNGTLKAGETENIPDEKEIELGAKELPTQGEPQLPEKSSSDEITGPEEFSVWKCFTHPTEALCHSRSVSDAVTGNKILFDHRKDLHSVG